MCLSSVNATMKPTRRRRSASSRLGPSGCGKSIFLSTLFHELNFPVPGRAYHLEADLEHLTALSDIYERSATPHGVGRSATCRNETHEYVFNCVASGGQRSRSCASAASTTRASSWRAARTSRAPIARTCRRASGGPRGHGDARRAASPRAVARRGGGRPRYFEATLRPMFSAAAEGLVPDPPGTDEVGSRARLRRACGNDRQGPARDVIDALWEFPHIRALIHARTAQQTVRLIPVSAVGTGFAELDCHRPRRQAPRRAPPAVQRRRPALHDPARPVRAGQHHPVEAQRADIDKEARRRLRRDTAAWLASLAS